jgi:hypothetical protein
MYLSGLQLTSLGSRTSSQRSVKRHGAMRKERSIIAATATAQNNKKGFNIGL